jgi:hypothetical protein
VSRVETVSISHDKLKQEWLSVRRGLASERERRPSSDHGLRQR